MPPFVINTCKRFKSFPADIFSFPTGYFFTAAGIILLT